MKLNKNSLVVLLVTFLAVILPPLGNDIYFSSLPQMGADFNTSEISWVVSIYLIGFAFGQLFYGPLSQRFGRKPVLLAAIGLVGLSCLVLFLTHSFAVFLVARFVQAVGACGTLSVILAIIRDSFSEERVVKVTGWMFAILGFIPALAPLLGSYIATVWHWRVDFLLLLVVATVIFIGVACFFTESMEAEDQQPLNLRHVIRQYKALCGCLSYLGYALSASFSYACFFLFLSSSPYLLIDQFHLSKETYGLLIAINALGIIVVGFLIPFLTKRFSVRQLMRFGSWLLVAGAFMMGLFYLLHLRDHVVYILLPSFVVFVGVGFIRPTASAGALTSASKDIAGYASALFSFIAFAGGALFTPFGEYAGSSALHLSVFLMITAVLTTVFSYLSRDKVK
jgi:MFS transporter, DHA1 family, multidrug resistance protein